VRRKSTFAAHFFVVQNNNKKKGGNEKKYIYAWISIKNAQKRIVQFVGKRCTEALYSVVFLQK